MGDSNQAKQVWVIGHKNPDTDAICAAITYANLKNKTSDGTVTYVPKRCGNLNGETSYVLKRFGVDLPEFVGNVGAQVKDVDFRRTVGIKGRLSLKRAWEMMKEMKVVALPVLGEDHHLDGMIVNGDLARTYMDMIDNCELSRANTPYSNIIDTIEGTLITGDKTACFNKGKVVVAAGNHKTMREYIEEGDLVILGNVEERQMVALSCKPSCMIVTAETFLPPEVIEEAMAIDCVLIMTPFDSFTVARLINQSIPVEYFMTKGNLITFFQDDYIEDITDTLAKVRHRSFPVLNDKHQYVGMFSRRHLMEMHKKQIILVDHNEFSQAVDGVEDAELLEIIDHHRIGGHQTNLPVFFRNQPLGCSNTIIYHMYKEQGVEIEPKIAGLMLSAILSDTLMFKSPTCTPVDVAAGKELARIVGVNYEEHAMAMFEAGSDFGDKTSKEILFTDFKIFSQGETTFGVSQVSVVSQNQIDNLSPGIAECLEDAMTEKGIHMIFVMLTNVIEQKSDVLCAGKHADTVIANGFGENAVTGAGTATLPGVVSRKKQMVPSLTAGLQQM